VFLVVAEKSRTLFSFLCSANTGIQELGGSIARQLA